MADGQNQSGFKVVVGDEDSPVSRRLVDYLRERGFSVEHITHGRFLKEKILSWRPSFVFCDLTLPDCKAPQLLQWMKDADEFKDYKPKILVTSAHNIVQNIRECIKLGAADYIVKPFKVEDVLTRLIFHIQNKREELSLSPVNRQLEGGDIYLNLLDIVMREALSQRSLEDILFNLTKMIAISLKAVRCSVIMSSEDLQTGQVMASSDDKTVKNLRLDLNKYPEVIHVMNTEKAVIIEDLEYDPMLAQIKNLVKGISFNSMIVCPVKRNGEMYGVVSARMDKNHSKFSERDIRFVQLVSQIMSLLLNTNLRLPHEWQNRGAA